MGTVVQTQTWWQIRPSNLSPDWFAHLQIVEAIEHISKKWFSYVREVACCSYLVSSSCLRLILGDLVALIRMQSYVEGPTLGPRSLYRPFSKTEYQQWPRSDSDLHSHVAVVARVSFLLCGISLLAIPILRIWIHYSKFTKIVPRGHYKRFKEHFYKAFCLKIPHHKLGDDNN